MIYKMLNNQYIDLSSIVSIKEVPNSNYFDVYFGYMKGIAIATTRDDYNLYIEDIYNDLLKAWKKFKSIKP